MEQFIPSNNLSKMIRGIHLSIENYDSPLDEYSFATTCFVVLRLDNCIDDLITASNIEKVTEYLNLTVRNFFNDYPDQFLEFREEFHKNLVTDNVNLNNFIIASGTLKPALEIAEKALLEIKETVDERSQYRVTSILLVNLFFVIAVRLYEFNFKFYIPTLFKFINEYGWIFRHDEDSKISEEYFYDFLSNNAPIQRHTAPKKEEALSLAKIIWSYDNAKLLLRKHVAKIVTDLLPQYELSISQVDNWLKQSEIVPVEILDRYKRHDYGNSKSEVNERAKLTAELMLRLSPIYCKDM